MIDPQKRFATGLDLCRYIESETGDTALLLFSCGKDAVCSWLQMRKVFKTIIPIYRALVPGLKFVEDNLAYYEHFFGTKILRYLHPAFLQNIRDADFQTPARARAIYGKDFPALYEASRPDVLQDAMRRTGRTDIWAGVGLRWADSLHRRKWIDLRGPWKVDAQEFYPVFDWKLDDFERELTASGCKLPTDYRLWNRSFDSPRYRFLKGMKETYPEDFERVKFFFPMIGVEFARRTFAEKHREANRPN